MNENSRRVLEMLSEGKVSVAEASACSPSSMKSQRRSQWCSRHHPREQPGI